MEKIRLGVAGVGNMGTAHVKKVITGKCPEFTVTAVADMNTERFAALKEICGEDLACFENAMDMLDSGLIDACLIATPHYDHCKLAIACMERGIHVMLEKPAGVYAKEVRQMNAVADKHPQVVFGMMFNQRTNHIYRKVKELIDSGKYGQIRRTNWIVTDWYRSQVYYDSGSWRATWAGEGGGVLLNQCPHQLDLWQWLCGMPVKVHGHLLYGKWHDIEVEDDVTAYVEYENGATGVFISTTGDGCGTNRLEIQMDKAKIIALEDKLELYEFDVSVPEFDKTNTRPFGHPNATCCEVETDGENLQHVAVLNAWAGAILRGEPLIANGKEGINGLTISNAIHLSSWLDKTITLPMDDELFYQELSKRIATSRAKTNVKAIVADTESSYGTTPTIK